MGVVWSERAVILMAHEWVGGRDVTVNVSGEVQKISA